MSKYSGKKLSFEIYGASHEKCVGIIGEGLPADFKPDLAALQAFCDRRRPGRGNFASARREEDIIIFDNELKAGCFRAHIENTDARSADYDGISTKPRPGTADYTSFIKDGRIYPGGGRFSGRMTAPLCILGGMCLQLLAERGINISSRLKSVGGKEGGFDELLKAAKIKGDSLGAVAEVSIKGVPAGLGDCLWDGLESSLSYLVFGIPGVKGIEFGSGFGGAAVTGSENNDTMRYDESGNVTFDTNNSGGILGGITTGADIVFSVAFKPTPSIGILQETVDLKTGRGCEIIIGGRHDVCYAPRALPALEAAAAIVIYDLLE